MCGEVAATGAVDAAAPRSVHTRSLRFPESCDMTKVDAKFNNGSLCVRCVGRARRRRAAADERGRAA